MKHYTEDLGFEYLCASNKQEFETVYERFLTPEITGKPMYLEVFTDSKDESSALELMLSIQDIDMSTKAKQIAKQALGRKGIDMAKRILGR